MRQITRKKVNRFIGTSIAILNGTMISSLFIQHDDRWKLMICIVLALLTFKIVVIDDHE